VNRVLFNEPTLTYRLPQPPAPTVQPGAILLCPFLPGPPIVAGFHECQLALYRLAFEQAQAAVTPSLLERDLLGVWN
jgi:hypothetical protein